MSHYKRGGARSQKEYKGSGFIHDDVKGALSEAIKSSEAVYNNDVSASLNSFASRALHSEPDDHVVIGNLDV
eukprot:7604320-Ditylum_brightwellii.AAC.1